MYRKKSGIYKITNTKNGKLYVGSSVSIYKRLNSHLWSLRNGKHKNPHLQNSFNLYGESVFKFESLEYTSIKDLILREQYWIDFFGLKNLYNLAPIAASQLGKPVSAETRQKISIANSGRTLSEQHKKLISLSSSGRRLSAKSREKISVARKKQIPPLLGRKFSSEHKARISASHMGNTYSLTKPVHKLDLITGEIIETFPSVAKAARAVNRDSSNISIACIQHGRTAAGYRWKFATQKDKQ